MTETILMGIDPGYDRLGWAVGKLSRERHWTSIDFGCIQTNAKQPLFDRYRELSREFQALLSEFRPTVAGIEAVYFSNNQKTALRVSEAKGLVLGQLVQLPSIIIYEFTPNQIKQTVTGYGSADKTAVAKMVQNTLQLEHTDVIDDAMDALAALITCQAWLGQPPQQL